MSQRTFALMSRVLTYDFRSIPGAISRGVALVITISVIYFMQYEVPMNSGQGLYLFQAIIFSNLFYIGILSLNDYATVITEEKKHKMLGLLLMTGINPLGILLGKSIPRQINALLLIIIQIPFTLLAITLGGVTLNQIIAAYCTLISFLFFVANFGLLCSVVSEDNKSAKSTTFTILVLLGIIPGILSLIGAFSYPFISRIGEYLAVFNPLNRLGIIMMTGFQGPLIGVQFYIHLIAGGIFIFLSWLVFENLIILNESKESVSIEKSRPFKKLRKSKKGKQISTRPSERSWDNALGWNHFHFTMGGRKAIKKRFLIFVFIFILVGTTSFLLGYFSRIKYGTPFSFKEWKMSQGIFMQVSMLIAFLIEPIINMQRLYSEEMLKNTYPGIYMLPMTLKQKTWNKFRGGFAFLIPSVVLFLVGYLIYPEAIPELLHDINNDTSLLQKVLLIISFYLVLLTTTFFSSLFVKKGSIISSWASFKLQALFGLLFIAYFGVILAILFIHVEMRNIPSPYEFTILCVPFIFLSLKLIHKAMVKQAEL